MAQTFRNARAVLVDATTEVYEVPAGASAVVIGAQVTNVAGSPVDVRFWWLDASAADVVTHLAFDVVVPSQAAYEPVGGKLVLEAGDRLQGSCVSGAPEVTVSVLELS